MAYTHIPHAATVLHLSAFRKLCPLQKTILQANSGMNRAARGSGYTKMEKTTQRLESWRKDREEIIKKENGAERSGKEGGKGEGEGRGGN